MRTISAWRRRSSIKVCGKRTDRLVLKLSNHFDFADDVAVELVELFSRNPVFLVSTTADGPGFITIPKRLSYTKACDITTFRIVIFCVPIPSYLHRVLFIHYRIENRLFRKSWRKCLVLAFPDQFQFLLAHWAK